MIRFQKKIHTWIFCLPSFFEVFGGSQSRFVEISWKNCGEKRNYWQDVCLNLSFWMLPVSLYLFLDFFFGKLVCIPPVCFLRDLDSEFRIKFKDFRELRLNSGILENFGIKINDLLPKKRFIHKSFQSRCFSFLCPSEPLQSPKPSPDQMRSQKNEIRNQYQNYR